MTDTLDPADGLTVHRGGVLEGVRLQPRQVAELALAAGFAGLDLYRCVCVCGGESAFWTRAHNDNRAAVSEIASGKQVRNVETGELVTVLDPLTGKIRLSDGEVVTVPLTVKYITSRDVGLMEINISAAAIGTQKEADLYDPAKNFAAARALFLQRGWEPWVAFTTNAYLIDTYRLWALVGIQSYYDRLLLDETHAAGKTSVLKVPLFSLNDARAKYVGLYVW